MRFDIRSTFIVILASLTIVNASSSSDAFIVEYTNDTLPASYLLSDYIVITSATNNKSCFAYRSSATEYGTRSLFETVPNRLFSVVFGFGTPDSPKILQATVESGSVFTVAAVPSSTQCILFYTKQDGQAAGVNFYALREDISTTSPYPFNGLRDVSNTLTAVLDPSNPSNGFILATAGIYNGVTVRYGMLRYDDSVSASPFSDLAAVDVTIATNNEVEQLNLHQYGAQSLSVLLLLKNGSQIWAGNINVAGTSFSGYNSLYYSNVLGIASQSISSGSTGAFCYTTISNEFVCNQWTPSNSTFGSEISRGPSTSKSIALSLLAHDSTAAVLFGQNGTSFFARQLQSGQLLSNNPFTLNLGSTSTMSFAATNANSDDMISLLVRDTSSGKMYLALVRHDWCGDGIQNSFEQCNSCDCTATPSSIPSTSSPIPGSGGSPTASPAKEPIDAPNLSGKTPTNGPTTEPPQVAVIVPAVVIPVVVVAAGLIILLVLLRRRKKRKGSLLHGKSRVEIAMESIDDRLKIPYKSLVFKKEIGAGSYGKVYVGEWKGTPVAIKVSSSVTDMDGFFDEARITVGLQQHPNVVQTFGVSLDGQLPCIVLEFCEGGSLDNRLFDSDVTMTQQQKIALIKGIARGLYHLHTNNIVHRDLAARNVLLNKSGTPKISDFGMSRVLKSEAEKGKTKTNYGPIRWMAPESLRDLQYSTKSDVWSFGIVLYEVVSRNEPHIDIDPLEVAVKIKNESYHPSIPQNVEPVLREIMLSCWQPDPNNRPSMEQICNKLNTSFPDD